MSKDIILKFVQAINEQDLPLIIKMMSEEFVFIDTYGGKEGKEQMKDGWKGYFEWFPDYRIDIEDYIENGEYAVILGRASGSYMGKEDRHWEFPAAWRVIVDSNHIKVWQVYCDSKKQLDSMD